MEITFRGRSMTLSRLVIDTGAEYTLISPDTVAKLNILPEDVGEIMTTHGIDYTSTIFRKVAV